MKGNDISKISRGEGMTNKPIVTCAGDWNLFCSLEAPLVAALPQDSSEWRRSYGRITKSVYIEATFIKFEKEKLPNDKNWNLLERPIFHMFWTDCVDLESYKTTLKESIDSWLKILQQKDITDWMIVLVETYDIKKVSKILPRTTVLDKIRSDFATKHDDRCLSVINPIKSESRSAESWRGLVSRIRHFILTAYNRTLIKFEEHMREQREKRNDPSWNFSDYFLLQEQLAFVLEMLGLYDEALVQYDELDALFTQFVLNSNITKSPLWLANFQRPVETWHGIKIGSNTPLKLRDSIIKKLASLLEFRSYLFQRQAAMLLFAFRPWEIAARCLSTIHNTIKEISILEINIPQGAASCWSLLACLETLRACERMTSSSATSSSGSAQQAVEMCSVHQAPLWHYAKDKIYELGKMCGLLPGSPPPSSEQLHIVVMLSAGMGDSEGNTLSGPQTPTDRLKEALCSKHAFQTHYLELAELAMGTYKHIGRLRCARYIGRDLAAFYSDLGEMGKAVVFLSDALRSYEEQSWKDLAAQTRLELVACFLKMEDHERYSKLSATIASSVELEILVRNFYFDEMMKTIRKNLISCQSTVLCEFSDCFKLLSVSVVSPEKGIHTKDNPVEVCLEIESLLPREAICTKLAISIEEVKDHGDGKNPDRRCNDKVNQKTELSIQGSPQRKMVNGPQVSENPYVDFVTSCHLDDLKPRNPILNPLNVVSQLHYKEDRTLDAVSVQCNSPKVALRRTDSNKYRKISATVRNDFTSCMLCSNFSIKPGHNEILLRTDARHSGLFKLGQISLVLEEKLEFLSDALVACKVCYEVTTQDVSVALNKVDAKRDLLAGLKHDMEVVITSGSVAIENAAVISLRASAGLVMQSHNSEESVREIIMKVPPCGPFETVRVPLHLLADLYPRKDDKPIEHKVWLQCPWWDTAVTVPLHFSSPFTPSWRLLTSNNRKYLHVTIAATVPEQVAFTISKPKLACEAKVTLVDMNPKSKEYMLCQSTAVSFMWQLKSDSLEMPSQALKIMFSMFYKPTDGDILEKEYKCPYDLQDYVTLFVVHSKLEPTKGSEFCRASQMSYLQLSVQKVNESDHLSLMYEVLADQTMWAVCGRTAGVISVENDESQVVTLEVMPLIAGYLPLPTVRLSKYIAATQIATKDPGRKAEVCMSSSQHPRLEPFSPGQVYHSGKSLQVHVLPNVNLHGDGH